MPKQTWVVRAGRDAAFLKSFIERSMVAIGWPEMGDLTNVHGRDAFATLTSRTYPDWTRHQQIVSAGQVYRFRDELGNGCRVLTYDPSERKYHVGIVTGNYEYGSDLDPELTHRKCVKWQSIVNRDELSPEARNSLGAIATIFCISDKASEEIESKLQGTATPVIKEEIVEADASEADPEQRALEFLQDRLAKMSWSDMQDFVAGLLRAMGYKTRVSPAGADRGRDIFASPDGFGFQTPRILVEVKHRIGAMNSEAIRSFASTLRDGDSGLYVSTGGFTKDARYEAERAVRHIALMDASDLGRAVAEHYDKMDAETRTLLPLKKIYWPI